MEIYYSQSNENECYVSNSVRNSHLSFEIDEMLSLKGFEKYKRQKQEKALNAFVLVSRGISVVELIRLLFALISKDTKITFIHIDKKSFFIFIVTKIIGLKNIHLNANSIFPSTIKFRQKIISQKGSRFVVPSLFHKIFYKLLRRKSITAKQLLGMLSEETAFIDFDKVVFHDKVSMKNSYLIHASHLVGLEVTCKLITTIDQASSNQLEAKLSNNNRLLSSLS